MSDFSVSIIEKKTVPNKIFIIPYRNRPEQKLFFTKYMEMILEHSAEYEIYFSHQADERIFNRGAAKNIGFLAIKNKYPDDYKTMNLIFHDLDTVPFHRIFDYTTKPGVVKHHYGFDHSLGGIVVIQGADFERINGYPNYWSWGLEDSCLQKRCIAANINIDRSQFYKIGSPEILHLFDGVSRIINKRDPKRFKIDNGLIGISTIHKLEYTLDNKSCNENDNLYQSINDKEFYINITAYQSESRFDDDQYFNYDLREPIRNITNPDPKKQTKQLVVNPNTWSNIPFVPTAQEKKMIIQSQRHQTVEQLQRPNFTPIQKPVFINKPHSMQRQQQQQQQQQQLTPQQYRQINTKNANVGLSIRR